jgi:hypothetical protein
LTFSEAGQLLVSAKIPFAGEIAILAMFTVAVPSLTSVTLMGGLLVLMVCPGNVRLLGEKEIALASPTPVRVIVCFGLPGLLSWIASDPVRVPALWV